ncbi:MAG: threonine synthase [Acidobacteriota bacterium]|nr:threonine synthase [Acidobacteriota bacterium]
MRYVSTRGTAPAVDLRTALFDGLAPDGGLYLPERLDPLPAAWIAARPGAALPDTAAGVLRPFTAGAIDEAALAALVGDALDFPIPLVPIEPRVWALELFHGPTLAFKDVAARVMARLMLALRPGGEPVTILVATSGDTGSAVAHAFARLPGMRVVILYPEGQVSPIQEAQLTTFDGDAAGRAQALAVAGTFDDCQRLVKGAFANATLRADVRLTSANSINIGRLLPQIVPYFHAAGQLPPGSPAPVFATPSGNFGHLTAGVMAARLGLAVARFVAATNVNDVVPHYLDTGRYEPRASRRTIANAMDVGDPSNFERMRVLYHDDVAAMRREITGCRHDDDRTREAIRDVYRRTGYLLDPHSAIGYLGLREELARSPRAAGIVMATAHPAKFSDIVEPVIGEAVAMPERLAACLARPKRFTRIPARPEALEEVLRG